MVLEVFFFQKNAQSLFKDIFSFKPGKYYIFDENFIMKEILLEFKNK